MTKEISNSEDIIDSRDVIARIEELGSELEEGSIDDPSDADLKEELASLKNLAEQCEGVSDWTYGESLIRDDYFEEYARELAEDIDAIQSDQGWPNYCIDWTFAAEELQMDYTPVDFDGVTYWIRSS
jgi:hypothetical protein